MALTYKKGSESAVAIGQKNLDTMIDWLAMFQYSTPLILSRVIGTVGKTSQHRLRDRLVNGGWATLTPTPGGTTGFRVRTRAKGEKATTSVPYILVPTQQALSLAQSRSKHNLPPKFSSKKVGDYIHHDLCAQSVIASVPLHHRGREGLEWEALSKHCLPSEHKHYDAAIRMNDEYLGIEVERSRKDPDRELFRTFDSILRSFSGYSNDGQRPCPKYRSAVYCFEEESLMELYQGYFERWCKLKDANGDQPNLKYLKDPDYFRCFRFVYFPRFKNERWS